MINQKKVDLAEKLVRAYGEAMNMLLTLSEIDEASHTDMVLINGRGMRIEVPNQAAEFIFRQMLAAQLQNIAMLEAQLVEVLTGEHRESEESADDPA
jgi:hypothetical protein